MIVSHERRFVFVKTRKTSGTSMEIALSRICGPDDIITPISFEDELLRLESGGRLPQNYGGLFEHHYRRAIRRQRRAPWRILRQGSFFNHMPAVDIRRRIGRAAWDEYFTFSIERHPYERVVSHVYFHARRRENFDFDRELRRVLDRGRYIDYPLYSEHWKPIVDFIVSFENLQNDLGVLSGKLGYDVAAHYPKAKHGFRGRRRPARELLSDAARAEIQENCRPEFELLGFEK